LDGDRLGDLDAAGRRARLRLPGHMLLEIATALLDEAGGAVETGVEFLQIGVSELGRAGGQGLGVAATPGGQGATRVGCSPAAPTAVTALFIGRRATDAAAAGWAARARDAGHGAGLGLGWAAAAGAWAARAALLDDIGRFHADHLRTLEDGLLDADVL